MFELNLMGLFIATWHFTEGADPDVDYDEDEVVSDHAWEESGKFEGDLILNERQRRLIVEDVAEGLARNGISDGTKRWPNNEVIVYIQVEHFSKQFVSFYEDTNKLPYPF